MNRILIIALEAPSATLLFAIHTLILISLICEEGGMLYFYPIFIQNKIFSMRSLLSKAIALFVFSICITDVIAQSYNDGPIELQVRVREINTQIGATDASILGVGFAPDELTYKVWARDNADLDGQSWQGGQCLQSNFNPPGLSTDFNQNIFSYIYPTAPVPQFFDIRGDFWEDDAGSDFACGGGRCAFDNNTCCGAIVFGVCVGVSQEDDLHCDANPLATGLDYRLGAPCQWYDHGYVSGSCGNDYRPRIESYWRYTRGTSCNNTIDLGTLNSGGTITHFNSNECYSNNFSASAGKDVFYQFTTTATTGVIISLCGAGTSFNTVLYLLDASCNQISVNDNFCGNVSEITTNLCTPGTYKLVIDGAAAASQGTFSLTITDDPSALMSVTVTGTNVTCNAGTDGTATANVTSGSSPFTYVWSPAAGNTPTVIGLTIGTYSVTVTDATGCTASGSVNITQPGALTFTTVATEPTCNGGTDGSITMTATGGTTPYQYSSDNGNIYQNGNILTGLDAGIYTLRVKDANNCTATATVTVTDPPAIAPNLTVSNISCNGAVDGSVVSNPTNGLAPYEFSLDSGPFVLTNSFTGLSTGFHLLNVRDANGCEEAAGFNIFEPSNLSSLVQAVVDVSCNGLSDGSFTITGVGGTQPYFYSLDNNVFQQSGTFTGLADGIYPVYIADSSGCAAINSVTVEEPAILAGSVLFQINISCNGSIDGTVVLTASGGTGPYQFSDDGVFFTTSGFFDRLPGGTYTYYLRDNNNCNDSITFTIFEPDTLALSAANVIDATCLGINNGSITLSATGGIQPYRYAINGGAFQSSPTFSGLTAGTFQFTVRDDEFCEYTETLAIGFITTITATINTIPIFCSGGATGTISVAGANGTPPYTYSIDGVNFQSSGTFNGLSSGTYTVTARDGFGCLAVQDVTLAEPGEIEITVVLSTPASCFNTTDGSLDIDVTGGNDPYQFIWSNGAVTQNLVNVTGGTYTVTVTDNNGCQDSLTAVIDATPALFIDVESIQNISCNGDEDAYINVSVNGGTLGYTYTWSNGENTEDIINIGTGSYALTVVDANNCSLTDIYIITAPTALIASITSTSNAVCNDENTGTITVAALGGVAPYEYSTNGFSFQSSSTFTDLAAGDYAVLVRDDNGCTASATTTIEEGGEIFLSYGEDIDLIKGRSVRLQPILVPANIVVDSVVWEPATGLSAIDTIAPIASPTETTVYTVTVYDSNGCAATAVVRVVVRDEYAIYMPNVFTPNSDGVNDRFSFYADGTENISVRIFNRWGAEVYYNPNQQPNVPNDGWDGMYNSKEAQQGAYMYLINVVYANNEERQETGTITLVR